MRLIGLMLSAALLAAAQTPAPKPELSAIMERGRSALAAYRYREADEEFRKAIAISPDLPAAHAQLARALLGEAPVNPALFPDNEGFLPKAEAEAREAVRLRPGDADFTALLATVVYKQPGGTRVAETVSLWNKVLALDPRSAQAHSELASIALRNVAVAVVNARFKSGMAIGEKKRLRDEAARQRLHQGYALAIEEAIKQAQQALDIDPHYVAAMRALSLALGTRANLSDSDAGYAADAKASDDWQQKAAAATPKPVAAPLPANNAAVIGAMISQMKVPPGTTKMIFSPPEVAQQNLIKRVEPIYPEAARSAGVQGKVVFRVTIGADGHVRTLDLVRGDPLLVKAAEDAVRQWVYKPFTAADGVALDAGTQVAVTVKP